MKYKNESSIAHKFVEIQFVMTIIYDELPVEMKQSSSVLMF